MSDQTTLNLAVTGIFLSLTLVLGLTKKSRNMREYALGKGQLGGGVTLMSLAATLISCQGIKLYHGLVVTLPQLLAVCSMAVLLGSLVLPKLNRFRHQHTLSGVMGELYGPKAIYITAFLGMVASCAVITAHLIFAGEMGRMIGLSSTSVILLLGGIITLYTLFGGMRLVLMTDVLQFGCIAFGTAIFTYLSFNTNPTQLEGSALQGHFKVFWSSSHMTERWLDLMFWGVFPTLFCFSPVIQRALMMKKKPQVRHAFLGMSLIFFTFSCLLFMASRHWAHHQLPMKGRGYRSHFLNLVGDDPVGRLGICLALLSFLTSTTNSFLHAAAIDVTYALQKAFPKRLSSKKLLFCSRYIVLVLGLLSTVVAYGCLSTQYSTAIAVLGYGFRVMSVLVVPLMAGLLGLRGHAKAFGSAVLIFFFMLLLSRYFFKAIWADGQVSAVAEQRSLSHMIRLAWLVSILVSAVVFFVAHYGCFRRFASVEAEKNWERKRNPWVDFTWLRRPAHWANQKAAQYGTMPYLLGLFLYISQMVPQLNIGAPEHLKAGTSFFIVLRGLGLLLATGLLLGDIWPQRMRPYFNLYYYLTIFYCVPFAAVMTSLHDPQGLFMISNVVLAIVLLGALVNWKACFNFFSLAALAALACFGLTHDAFLPEFGRYGGFCLAYNIVYSLFVCLAFMRKQQISSQQKQEQLARAKAEKARQLTLHRASEAQLFSMIGEQSSVMKAIKGVVETQKKGILLAEDIAKLENIMAYFKIIRNNAMEYLPLQAKRGDIEALFQDVVMRLKTLNMLDGVEIKCDLEPGDQTMVWDLDYIRKLMINAIQHCAKFHPDTDVYCHVDRSVIDYGISGMNNVACYRITISNQSYHTGPLGYLFSHRSPMFNQDQLHLRENQRITYAHYGMMVFQAEGDQCSQTYVLPIDVNGVRPKISQFVDEGTDMKMRLNSPKDLDFLARIKRLDVDFERVEKALKRAKYFHKEQKRHSGEPFYHHPLAVATILLEHTQDEDTIVAALLHDVVEDTPYNLQQMTLEFGLSVAQIVDQVTNLHSGRLRKFKMSKAQVLLALLEKENDKALLVKTADFLHNMRTIMGHPSPSKREAIAMRGRDFFVPIAQSLGLRGVAKELQDRCDVVLNDTLVAVNVELGVVT